MKTQLSGLHIYIYLYVFLTKTMTKESKIERFIIKCGSGFAAVLSPVLQLFSFVLWFNRIATCLCLAMIFPMMPSATLS